MKRWQIVDLDGHPLLDPKTGQKMEPSTYFNSFSPPAAGWFSPGSVT